MDNKEEQKIANNKVTAEELHQTSLQNLTKNLSNVSVGETSYNSKDDVFVDTQEFKSQNLKDDTAPIASDVTFRQRPIAVQNQMQTCQPPYNLYSPYGAPTAYHRRPGNSTPARLNFGGNISRPHSTDDLQSISGSVYGQQRVTYKNPKKDKRTMVLQLVVPSPPLTGTHSDGNFFEYPENYTETVRRPHSESDTIPQQMNQEPYNEFYSQNGEVSTTNDIYLPSNYSYYTQKPPRSPENSETNTHKTHDTQKEPSSSKEKKKMFGATLSSTLGLAYGLANICLGVSFYVIDMLNLEDKNVNFLAEGFSLYLLITALVYFLYLIIDVSVYVRKRRKYEKLQAENTENSIEMKNNYNGTMELNISLPQILSLKSQMDHRYCFNKDRHSTSFYLKLGAAGFCFGHLIHSILILVYRSMSIGSTNSDCFNKVTFTIEILYPLYSVVLLFFIFKYSNLIINKNTGVHRLGFMHCISSSLCFWVWTIFRETAEYLAYQKKIYEDKEYEIELNHTSLDKTLLLPGIAPKRFTKMCQHDELTYIYQNLSPYLYPFSIEFSILAVGILIMVWQNIGLCKEDADHNLDHNQESHETQYRRKPSVPESNVAIHADCHAATKGLFVGFFVLVFAIVATIVFFVSYYNNLGDNGYWMKRITYVVIMVMMIIAVVAAYVQIVKLDVNHEAHNTLDNILLMICLPAYFVNTIFSIIPGIIFKRPLAIAELVTEIVQILIQTPFMIDGMARSSNSKELRKKKPGRQWVTFLVVANVAMWIMETFEVKSHGLEQYRQDYYSKELWSIVGHICLPLTMFYRFHSSACLGDIWKFGYMRSGH